MKNYSGYGKVIDTYGFTFGDAPYQKVYNPEGIPIERIPNTDVEGMNDQEIEFCKIIHSNQDLLGLFHSHTKSKFIETGASDGAIIDSNAFSTYVSNIINRLTTTDISNAENECMKSQMIHKMYTRGQQIKYAVNNTKYESNIMPMRNYDLLDVSLPEDQNFIQNNDIFYDRLTGYNDSIIFPISSNIGQNYMTSPYNIPVISFDRKNHIDHTEKEKELRLFEIKVNYDPTRVSDLFELIRCNLMRQTLNNSIYTLIITYIVKEHVRNVPINYTNQRNSSALLQEEKSILRDVYIPPMIINLRVNIEVESLREAIDNMSSSPGNAKFIKPSYGEKDIAIFTYFTPTLKHYLLHAFLGDKNKKGGDYKYQEELLMNWTIKSTLFSQNFLRHNMDRAFQPYITSWPFGNVYNDGTPCISTNSLKAYYNVINDADIIKEKRVNVHNIMTMFYNVFMVNPFNSDMRQLCFIDYKKYKQFLDEYYDGSMSQEDLVKDMYKYIKKYLKL